MIGQNARTEPSPRAALPERAGDSGARIMEVLPDRPGGPRQGCDGPGQNRGFTAGGSVAQRQTAPFQHSQQRCLRPEGNSPISSRSNVPPAAEQSTLIADRPVNDPARWLNNWPAQVFAEPAAVDGRKGPSRLAGGEGP